MPSDPRLAFPISTSSISQSSTTLSPTSSSSKQKLSITNSAYHKRTEHTQYSTVTDQTQKLASLEISPANSPLNASPSYNINSLNLSGYSTSNTFPTSSQISSGSRVYTNSGVINEHDDSTYECHTGPPDTDCIPLLSNDNQMELPLNIPFNQIHSCYTTPFQKFKRCTHHIINILPAVILGWLMNVLDAISYGMLLFPLSSPIFADTSSDGISMFYVSCLASQFVFSAGASAFSGGIGSEMIEGVPFFHSIAYTIINDMRENASSRAIIATVVMALAISSIFTGLTFIGLGSLKLGSIVAFFPRSILTGCIGGVGIFLLLTGVLVSSGLDKSHHDMMTLLVQLFEPSTLPLWTIPIGLAVLLKSIKCRLSHQGIIPLFFVLVTLVFYTVSFIHPALNIPLLRRKGWIFVKPTNAVPFWHFYTYFDFGLTDWRAIAKSFPSILALSFFSVLHVPINVPALAFATGNDNINVNRELIAHGISNMASGLLGSVQNYLVYSNSAIFIRTGGDSRFAGVCLALATGITWIAGSGLIGYIPIMIVGALVFLVGIELVEEAIWESWQRMNHWEYTMIVVVSLIMGFYDFVAGLVVGLILACMNFVGQNFRISAIRATYTGAIAESWVRRHAYHRQYLRERGEQIMLVKLRGYLFFGSIVSVENQVTAYAKDSETFGKHKETYLIFDFENVVGIDFSAAEAFTRMRRILAPRNVRMVYSGLAEHSDIEDSLRMAQYGPWLSRNFRSGDNEGFKVYRTLSEALETCENEILTAQVNKKYSNTGTSGYERYSEGCHETEVDRIIEGVKKGEQGGEGEGYRDDADNDDDDDTLPMDRLMWVKDSRSKGERNVVNLLAYTFKDVSQKNREFWGRVAGYFERKELEAGVLLYQRGDAALDGFYVVESGMLRVEYDLDQGLVWERIVAGTTCGELPFFAEEKRTGSVWAETKCVTWVLTYDSWHLIKRNEPEIAEELVRCAMRLTMERMNSITRDTDAQEEAVRLTKVGSSG